MKVFVYGTLKSRCCNHHILAGIMPKYPPLKVVTKEKYPMYKSERYFPYLEDQKGVGHHIQGELWEIADSGADKLDAFEGVPTLYRRGKIDVLHGDELHTDINVYFKATNTDVSNKNLLSEWVEK